MKERFEDKAPNLTSDTPVLFLGGPMNKRVEEWGTVPRGRMVCFHNPTDGLVHEYTFRFILSDDKQGVDAVLCDHQGARPHIDDFNRGIRS
jgi:hypothetical protein